VNRLSRLVAITPVISGAVAILAYKEVFRVVDILVRAGLDVVDDLAAESVLLFAVWPPGPKATYAGLEVNEDGPRNVAGIVALIVKDVFPVAAFGSEVFQVSVLANAMLLTQLLPELAPN